MTEQFSSRLPTGSARFWIPLGAIAVVAAAIRIVYALSIVADGPLRGDAYFYHYGANLLADGEGFVVPHEYYELGLRTEAAEHPPAFVAYLGLWSVLGLRSEAAHYVAGALLGVVAVVLVGMLARRLVGPATGLVAAGIAAIYPNLFGWDSMLLSEPTATVAVLLVCLAAYRHLEAPTIGSAVLLGGLVGVAAHTRAELLLLSVLIVVPAVFSPRRGQLRSRVGHLAVAGTACVLVIAPWLLYNLSRFDKPVFMSTGLDITLAYSNCESSYSGTLRGYWDLRCALDVIDEVGPDFYLLDQSQRGALFREAAVDHVRDNLDQLPEIVAVRVGRVAGLYRPQEQVGLDIIVEQREEWVARSGMWAYRGLALLSVGGFIILGQRGVARYPLVAPIVVVLAATAITFGATRYRAIAEPMLAILAAVWLVEVTRRARDRWLDRRGVDRSAPTT